MYYCASEMYWFCSQCRLEFSFNNFVWSFGIFRIPFHYFTRFCSTFCIYLDHDGQFGKLLAENCIC